MARAPLTCEADIKGLKNNQLIANLKKWEFGKESVIYLGHMIDGGEMRVDIDKIASINQWHTPTSLT